MYSFDEVSTSRGKETLGDALYKLERFAKAPRLTKLAEWAGQELRDFDGSYAEIAEKARLEYRSIQGGIRDSEYCSNPWLMLQLIRQKIILSCP